ncbi:heme exporter protein CcmD [Rhodoferax lacus]|uniref:Heme exporter protein D n=1 Tax=Rhodoferax lacus TaxID=2184758 RepID=A0A3E1R7M1_9BURK|nr:heme exporter protein CcmD [Rhodoferax lacus]RFO95375.1 heme exporter protein CcmD [Rhodoferax lacus]
MIWNSASDFFAMGGYGLYVWGSYAVTAAWMLLEPALAAQRHRAALRAAAELNEEGEQV